MRQVSRPPASVVDRARSEPDRTTIPAIRWENFQLAEVGFFDRRAQNSRAPRGWLGRTVAFAWRAKRHSARCQAGLLLVVRSRRLVTVGAGDCIQTIWGVVRWLRDRCP
jgi:hypothetical protein